MRVVEGRNWDMNKGKSCSASRSVVEVCECDTVRCVLTCVRAAA